LPTAAKLAISNIAWDPLDDAAAAELMRAEGFTGLEIAPTVRWSSPMEVPDHDVDAYRAWWEERGIRVVALQSLLFGRPDLVLFGSESARRALADHFTGMIALARRLGAGVLVFGSPKNRQRGAVPLAEAMAIAAEFFRRVGAVAAANATKICIEPNPPDYGCDFITTTAEAAALCARVASPGVLVQGDLGAMQMVGDSPAVAIAAAGSRIGHFHASEPNLAESGSGPAGAKPHEEAAHALREQAYPGWISIEMRRLNAPGHDGSVERVRRALRVVRRAYGDPRA